MNKTMIHNTFCKTGKANRLTPDQVAFETLYFINTVNNAGADGTAIKFPTVYEAEKVISPMLKRVLNKLAPEEIAYLNERIEAIL